MQHTISIDQLRIGLYIHLDLGWMHHPFSVSSFKIKTDEQLQTLRTLGLERLRYDPERSDVVPAVVPAAGAVPAPAPAPVASASAPAVEDPAMAAKRERQERLRKQRENLARVGRQFVKAAATVRDLHKGLKQHPAQTVTETAAFVEQLAAQFLDDRDLTIHSVGSGHGGADFYVHTLNVALLSLLVAKEMQLAPADACMLGQGALYHDLGLQDVPSRILRNTETLSGPERAAREQHCEFGVVAGKALNLPTQVLEIIAQHHEWADGTGYPARRKGEGIAPLARIVAVVNQYDNLCNPVNPARALTPHEALSHIFTQQRAKFDAKVMQILVRCLGVYPPGTIVSLSNEAVGMVTAVNTARPLKPTVVLYDAGTPRDQPIVLDLQDEPDLNITRAVRIAQLRPEVLDYLAGRIRRVSYFFDASAAEGAAT